MDKDKQDKQAFEAMRKYRDQNFSVRIRRLHTIERMYPDEISFERTTNGSQWDGMSMNRREAKIIITAIVDHYKIDLKEIQLPVPVVKR